MPTEAKKVTFRPKQETTDGSGDVIAYMIPNKEVNLFYAYNPWLDGNFAPHQTVAEMEACYDAQNAKNTSNGFKNLTNIFYNLSQNVRTVTIRTRTTTIGLSGIPPSSSSSVHLIRMVRRLCWMASVVFTTSILRVLRPGRSTLFLFPPS
jgi:hypothetical protein